MITAEASTDREEAENAPSGFLMAVASVLALGDPAIERYFHFLPYPETLTARAIAATREALALVRCDATNTETAAQRVLESRLDFQTLYRLLGAMTPPPALERFHELYSAFAVSYVFAMDLLRRGYDQRNEHLFVAVQPHVQEAMNTQIAMVRELLDCSDLKGRLTHGN